MASRRSVHIERSDKMQFLVDGSKVISGLLSIVFKIRKNVSLQDLVDSVYQLRFSTGNRLNQTSDR